MQYEKEQLDQQHQLLHQLLRLMKEVDVMKIDLVNRIQHSLVFKFFYAPKIGTPEGIVISDQLQDESSSAARNIEKAQSQPRWDHEEQALLVVE